MRAKALSRPAIESERTDPWVDTPKINLGPSRPQNGDFPEVR